MVQLKLRSASDEGAVTSGRWAGLTRRLGLEQAAKASRDGAKTQAANVTPWLLTVNLVNPEWRAV